MNFSGDANWCQLTWCYVNSDCETGTASGVFQGYDLFYSYDVCGSPDCYNNPDALECPWDPHGDETYRVFKDSCKCKYHGSTLSESVLTQYPDSDPGKYKNLSHIEYYGTTCAAWDMSPDTPWSEWCPDGADWCTTTYNWCQAPWCYVEAACPTKVASSVFEGSDDTAYSYDTCLSTPDCFNTHSSGEYAEGCPFFGNDDGGWYTPKSCPRGFTDKDDRCVQISWAKFPEFSTIMAARGFQPRVCASP